MPNSSVNVPLDNFIQNGDLTLEELLTSVATVNGGIRPGVADPIRDPATGRLIQVRLGDIVGRPTEHDHCSEEGKYQ